MPDNPGNGTSATAATPLMPHLGKPNLGLEQRPDGQPRFKGCSRISTYEMLSKLGEGTFGEVHKARHIQTGQLVALKKILMHNEKDGFPITALREIKLLKMLSHRNILKLEEMAVESRKGEGKKKAHMYMVTPYMDHDLSGLLENPTVRMTEPQIKCYMLQLLEGVRYLHSQKILHRDMKAANLLINNAGILQIADFGLARPYDEDPPQAGKGGGEATRDYTTLVVTRWYRPPELLLQLRKYTTAIDMWGVGCVLGEMFKKRPILAGKSDLNQIQQIFALVGSPTEESMPGWSELPGFKKEGITSYGLSKGNLDERFREQSPGMRSLLQKLLLLDWRKRINAIDALEHPYFKTPPLPARPGDIPQFEESHELDRRKFRDQQAALPPAPAGGTVGMGPQTGGEWGQATGNDNFQYNGKRHPPYNRDHDNGRIPPPPPPPPYRARDHRDNGVGPPPFNSGRDRDRDRDRERRPAWDRSRDHRNGLPPPAGGANALPPRPTFDASWSQVDGESGGSGGRAPPRRHDQGHSRHNGSGGGGGGAATDTYIPSYVNGDSREGRDGRPGRYDAPIPRHERDRTRGWEREREREKERERRDPLYDSVGRGRSRSPGVRSGDGRERDRVREDYRR